MAHLACRIVIAAAALCWGMAPAQAGDFHGDFHGVAVQVSNGKRIPSAAQLREILRPGDMVRDVLGWHRVDRSCDLATNPARQIEIPDAMMTLYRNVAAAQGQNFVTLAFNNKKCGQPGNSGAQTFPTTPALRAEFAAYAADVARRVPSLGGISLWNELNGTWNGKLPMSQRLTQYCLLANDVIAAVRKVNPKLPIAIGASVGWNVDAWFIEMFEKRDCIGKGDPNIWLDVHPFLNGKKVGKTKKTDFQLWQASVDNIRKHGITNPLIATEWGAKAAYVWQTAHPGKSYMKEFQEEVLSQDPDWAGAFWFEMLYDVKAPNAGLYNKSDELTLFGSQYLETFRN
jgi:hypothetical protein